LNVLFALLISSFFLLLAPTAACSANSESSQPSQLSFAESLYSEEDYYRAITEYKRFLHYHPNHPAAAHATLNMARCFLHGEQWSKGEEALSKLIQRYPNSQESDYAAILYAEIPYKQHNFNRTLDRLSQNALQTSPAALAQHRADLRLWSLASNGNYDQFINNETPDTQYSQLNGELQLLNQLPLKSPRLAGGLSAIIPGSGQLYAGRYREAGMSLLLNAAFLGGGIQSIKTGNHVLGGILLFFEAGWYGGNIHNAMNSVHKYNRDLQQSAVSRLIEQYNFSLLIDDKTTGLQISGRFN